MRFPRKDNSLNDMIEAMDEVFLKAKAQAKTDIAAIPLAWQMLGDDYLQAIDGEIEKCVLDRRYFLENYYAIRDESGRIHSLYPWFSHQDIIYEAVQEELRNKGCCRLIILKPRQAGSTTWNAALIFHATLFVPDSYSLMMGQDNEVSAEIYQRVMYAFQNLPWWMWAEAMSKQQGLKVMFERSDEHTRITDPGLGSTLMISNAQKATGVAIGRCQLPITVVWTENGPVSLQEIFEEYAESEPEETDEIGSWYALRRSLRVYSSNDGVGLLKNVSRIYRQKYKGTIERVQIEGGVDLFKTPEHGVLCENAWKKRLSAGDYVSRLGQISRDPYSRDETFPEEAELLGWQIAEGHELKNGLYITQKEDCTRDYLAALIERVAKPVTLYNRPAKGKFNKFGNEYVGYVYAGCKQYRRSLERRGYRWGCNWTKKRIPEFIFRASDECVAAFLRGFFEAEGSVSHVIDIGQMSKRLMDGLRFLSARLGITLRFSTVQKEEKRTNRRNYKWTYYRGFIGGPSLVRFNEKVGFISERKQQRLKATAEKSKGSNVEVQVTATRMIRTGVKECGTSCKWVMGSGRYQDKQMLSMKSARAAIAKWKSAITNTPMNGSRIHQAFKAFDSIKSTQWIGRVERELNKNRAFDKVIEVKEQEYDGDVFDLEVEDLHNYTVGGVVTHNTIRNVMASEVSRWPDSTVWTADIEPSLNAPDMLGIMESTAFGQSGLYYHMWKAAEEGESDWRALFVPVYKVKKYFLPIEPGEQIVLTPEETGLRKRVKQEENYTIPLGFFKWRRRKIRACIAATGSEEAHPESYPCSAMEAFISSGACAFPRRELDRQVNNNCCDPSWIGEIEYVSPDQSPVLHLHHPESVELKKKPDRSNRLWVWEYPQETGDYQISCDQGGTGEENDFTAAAIYKIGVDTGDPASSVPDEQVAEWHGHINASHMAKVLAALGKWYNMAEIAVEYARDGITTGNELQHNEHIDYPNLYRWKRLDKIGNVMSFHTHWITNSVTREDMINRMAERLLDHQIIIRSVHALKEMRNFGREEGQLKAQGLDDHDDYAIAHMIAIASANQSNRRQLRSEAMSMGSGVSSATAAAVMPRVPTLYGIYDGYGRQQNTDVPITSEKQAKEIIASCSKKVNLDLSKFWTIKPITVCKANTPWSASWDSDGAERELRESYGVDPRNQTSDLIATYRQMLNNQRGGNNPASNMETLDE